MTTAMQSKATITVTCDCCGEQYEAEPQQGHRLLCGDSTKREDVARLMADTKPFQCVWTDPPYGVNHSGGSKDPRSRTYRSGDTLRNDNLSEGATESLVTHALAHAVEHAAPGASVYVACPPGTPLPHFIAAVDASGFQFMHSLAWVKDSFVFGRCDYHYRHETILYGWLHNGAHYFTDDRTQDSVFEVPRPKRSEEHPTMKPVVLVAIMLGNSSREGDAVYEPFCGSGSTLIAAERLGRQCRAIEIDPRYCDVILRRWEAETGRVATLLSRVSEPENEPAQAAAR